MGTALDFSNVHDEIVKLYIDDGYSAKIVAERLTSSGFVTSQITLLRYLKKQGLVKERGTPGFCAKANCSSCGEEFMRSNPRHKWCEQCLPDRSNRWRLSRFGINQARFDEMVLLQRNGCAICKSSFDSQKIYIDHDHVTNHVRGLLCNRCNVNLAFVEQPTLLESALQYLRCSQAAVQITTAAR